MALQLTDPWLLLSVPYASVEGPVGRELITAAGDYINRAVFTDAEFEEGIERLKSEGYVCEAAAGYEVSPRVREWFRRECPGRSSVHRDLERLTRLLGVRSEEAP